MNPKTEALAFRIWCFADPRGWDVTLTEIAEHVGVHHNRAMAICRERGWLERVRVLTASRSTFIYPGLTSEDMFEGLA